MALKIIFLTAKKFYFIIIKIFLINYNNFNKELWKKKFGPLNMLIIRKIKENKIIQNLNFKKKLF